jgi:flagellar protein FliO/FliZ
MKFTASQLVKSSSAVLFCTLSAVLAAGAQAADAVSAATAGIPAAAPAALSAAPATSTTSNLLQVILGLGVVLVLMALSAWLLKRFSSAGTNANGQIKIVGGVSVGSRERVLVVEIGDQWIVVGVAPGRVNSLATLPRQASPDVAASGPSAPNFAAWLKQTIEKRNAN